MKGKAMAGKMCSYSKMSGVHPGGSHWGRPPSGEFTRRKRVKCPTCGRKMWAAIRTCHDGCCIYHCVPPHKVKGWWKKGKKTTRKSMKKQRFRRTR